MQPEAAHQAILPKSDQPGAAAKSIRLRGAMILAGSLVVLLLVCQQTELPACSFRTTTGMPCPGCGMTTSMAAMTRGQVTVALRSHLFGVILFLAVCVLAVVGVVELACGKAVIGLLRPGIWWVWVGLTGLLGGWAANIALGLLSGQLPAR
ncbi:MAG: DUF2752 domain-containing protein [Phycisphaerae bacterium]|nr:DUF2752 domain-containing protein [Phycisphaerae bacterium]